MQRLEEGQKFERYRVLRETGNSVAGTSYEAEDTKAQRRVIIKLIHPWSPLTDAGRREFFRDMQDISRTSHPYLTPILNYGELNGQLYVARNYMPVGSLLSETGRNWFQTPLAVDQICHYVEKLAQTLDFLHQKGRIHGSITLANLLIQSDPSKDATQFPLSLADMGYTTFVRKFGIAHPARYPITAAPEQYKGQLYPQSDQYALAVILYYWFTGSFPFQGSPEEIEAMKKAEAWIPLKRHNVNTTLQQEGILRKALSAQPRERYTTVLTFAQAIIQSFRQEASKNHRNHIMHRQDQQQAFQRQTNEKAIKVRAEEDPQREPLPQTIPDVPQPQPLEPTPSPIPDPLPKPQEPPAQPQTPTEPEPDNVPKPEPDIAQPLPDQTPFTEPPLPKPPGEPQKETTNWQIEIGEIPVNTDTNKAYLKIESPYQPDPIEIALEKEEITLGHAGSSDILLDQDQQTSRHHALIKRNKGHYHISDRHSTFGVKVNERTLSSDIEYQLQNGDQIYIGEYILTFVFI